MKKKWNTFLDGTPKHRQTVDVKTDSGEVLEGCVCKFGAFFRNGQKIYEGITAWRDHGENREEPDSEERLLQSGDKAAAPTVRDQ